MSAYATETLFKEAAGWNLFDVNVRVGPSGIHGELALDAPSLLQEMDRFFIREAIASHWTAEEYDVPAGNAALTNIANPRLTPAWAALPVTDLSAHKPKAVRLTPSLNQHSFSTAQWCAGPLFDYLEAHRVITLIVRPDIDWPDLKRLLETYPRLPIVLLDTGYRADRYLFPLLKQHSNLHFDTATYLAHRQLEAFVETHGPHQALFGTRLPLYTPAAALGVLATARISDQMRLAIAGGNLRRLLGEVQS